MSETAPPSEDVDDSESSDIKFYFYLGSQVIAAAVLLATVAAVPLFLTNDKSTELALQIDQQGDESWKQGDIHPDFALDDQPFTIEPAAGPSNLD